MMWTSNVALATLTISSLFSLATAQFAQCVQKCIDQETSQSCSLADFPCICRQSSGNFLPNVISCMHDQCDNNLDNSIFLTPLSLICQLAGSPLPASAVSSAQNEASSLNAQPVTVTATVTGGGGGGSVPIATTTISGPWTTATLSGHTFTWGGPETSTIFDSSVSMTSSAASMPTASTSDGLIGFIPIVLTTTNSAGSTYTTTTSTPGAVSTYTTTNSQGATVVQTSTYMQSTGSSTGQGSSSSRASTSSATRSSSSGSSAVAGGGSSSSTGTTRSLRTSTIFTPEKTSAGSSSRTSTESQSSSTDSAPFTNTNVGARGNVGSWLGLSVFLAFIGFWF